ncbi:MAG TPA: HAD-IIA family hydrolase [Actinomycetota bacterium]
MPVPARIEGLLLDIDGVLTVSWDPLPGASDAVQWLRTSRLPFRLLTNTTTYGRTTLAELLSDAGLGVAPEEIVTAAVSTAEFLRREHAGERCFLLGQPELEEDFAGVEFVEDDAGVVVVAGADDAFTWGNLNRALMMLRSGAQLVAMHRNVTWTTAEGLKLDAGAFLLGLEAASGVEATVIGKPNREFFLQAVGLLGLEPGAVAMVGDDAESDVAAAQRAGLTGILVRTGKFAPQDVERASMKPHHSIDSVGDLPALVERLRS